MGIVSFSTKSHWSDVNLWQSFGAKRSSTLQPWETPRTFLQAEEMCLYWTHCLNAPAKFLP